MFKADNIPSHSVSDNIRVAILRELEIMAGAGGGGLATEATLLQVLNNMIASQDIEILLVRDTGGADPTKVYQQIREYDQGTGAWNTRYEDAGGAAYVPVGPVEYLDPSAVLNLILTELQSIDAKVATEVTLNNLLTAFNGEDFASETTLAALNTYIQGFDFATQTTLASLLTAFNSEDFASQTTLNALLTAFNAEDFASQTTLNALLTAFNSEDFASETTLATISTNIAAINTKLTGVSRTPACTIAVANGSTAAGAKAVSLWFRGGGGTLDGAAVPNGARFNFEAKKGEDTVGSIAYTVPTGGPQQIIITTLT